jgi:hypothetical protein
MKFRKKPVVIDAIQFIDDESETLIKIHQFMDASDLRISYAIPNKPVIIIETLEGDMGASIGDYIIKGIQGEFYPCKPDIFEATYEEVK